MYLYETHLPVRNTEASQRFYRAVIGLEFAYRDPTRDIVFLWIGGAKRSMLGLWGPDTLYGRHPHKCHLAFAVSLPEVLAAGERLNGLGVPSRNFSGAATTEPSVIGWMPSAQIYFSDPDGHALEYIAVLEEPPDAGFLGSFSSWRQRAGPTPPPVSVRTSREESVPRTTGRSGRRNSEADPGTSSASVSARRRKADE